MQDDRTERVWDPLIRVFHWGVAVAFALAWLTGEAETPLHDLFGYAILVLIGMRVVWGLIGTRHARFTDFVRRPATVIAYLRDIAAFRARRHLGHNPAGGAMVVLMLLSLVATSVTGMMLEGAEFGTGWFAEWGNARAYGHDAAEWIEELHEAVAGFTLLLVTLHVAGVLLASLQHGENLIRSMLDGRKRAGD